MKLDKEDTHADEQGRDGSAVLQVDHSQQVGQVTLSGSRETQPADTNIRSVSSRIKTVFCRPTRKLASTKSLWDFCTGFHIIAENVTNKFSEKTFTNKHYL